MSSKKPSCVHPLIVFLIFLSIPLPSSSTDTNFTFNGFHSSELILDGVAQITSNGLLLVSDHTANESALSYNSQIGHAFYPHPIPLKPSSSSSSNGSAFSFSTSFVFAIRPEESHLSSHGIVFVMAPNPAALNWSFGSEYLGLFNQSNNGDSSNHVFGVELDTVRDAQFNDTNNNHVGIDINSLTSNISAPASYFHNKSYSENLSIFSGQPMRVWVEYDGAEMKTTVTIAPVKIEKPKIPLLTLRRNLSPVFNDYMYVGFSSSTGSAYTYHYILAWSFAVNGSCAEIDISKLPELPLHLTSKDVSTMIKIGVITIIVASALIVSTIIYFVRRRRKYAEEVDDWESDYGPHRFHYKDLYVATKGFKEKGLLGRGGFGRVYRGILPKSKIEVAVKKISHESRQGMREFVAEIVSLGRLRHRNIVQLLGYCRRKGELLLVYDYMPNGSLDKYLHSRNDCLIHGDFHSENEQQHRLMLNWEQRFKIIKGVASGLLYLHEEWEQVVVHRDIKPSNVLLDSDLNGRLGDFGLARLYDHGSDPQTTHVVGTMGYLAPEQAWTGRATRSSDVYGFGAFLLEVVCGRRPINLKADNEEIILVDWVLGKWKNGNLLSVVDPRLEGEFEEEEAMMVVKLGMMCSTLEPRSRPTMREIVGYLEGLVKLPDWNARDIEFLSGGVVFGGCHERTVGEVAGGSGQMSTVEFFSDYVISSQSMSSMATASTPVDAVVSMDGDSFLRESL